MVEVSKYSSSWNFTLGYPSFTANAEILFIFTPNSPTYSHKLHKPSLEVIHLIIVVSNTIVN